MRVEFTRVILCVRVRIIFFACLFRMPEHRSEPKRKIRNPIEEVADNSRVAEVSSDEAIKEAVVQEMAVERRELQEGMDDTSSDSESSGEPTESRSGGGVVPQIGVGMYQHPRVIGSVTAV